MGGVRVEQGRTSDDAKYTQAVNKYWNSAIPAGQPDPTSRLLVAMALACQDENSVCSAAFASETLTAAALRAQYNNGCRGKCLDEYAHKIETLSTLMSSALMQGAETGNSKAATSAAAMSGDLELLGLAKGGRLGGCNGRSFSPDTKVVMADGTAKPIKDVHKGDTVRTTDPLTGADAKRVVIATHLNRDRDVADLIIADTHGRTTIVHTTESHAFWDDTQQSWVNAGDLHHGDRLRTVEGAARRVVAVVPMLGTQSMYNLTVANDHTYYVLAGNTPVLVHNTNGCGLPDLAVNSAQFGKKWGKHAQDYGLDPANPADREWFLNRMQEIHKGPHEVRIGPIMKDGPDNIMYRNGNDLLITKTDGTFVSMYPGGNTSTWFANGTPRPCACPG